MAGDLDIFDALPDEHRLLDRLFAQHQEAVLVRDWEGAGAKLAEFRSLLLSHFKVENEAVLPVYGERVGKLPGGSAEVFLLEHRRAERLLAEVENRFQRLSRSPTRRGTIALLDFEKLFKDYLSHHNLRERNLLYPKCREAFTPAERDAVRRAWAREQE